MPNDLLNKINDTSLPLDDRRAHLEFDDLFKKHKRKHRREEAINICFIIFICLCLLIICGVVVIKIWHMVTPQAKWWLTKEQISEINDFFVDGSIGGFLVGIFKSKILNKNEEE